MADELKCDECGCWSAKCQYDERMNKTLCPRCLWRQANDRLKGVVVEDEETDLEPQWMED